MLSMTLDTTRPFIDMLWIRDLESYSCASTLGLLFLLPQIRRVGKPILPITILRERPQIDRAFVILVIVFDGDVGGLRSSPLPKTPIGHMAVLD